MLLLCSLVLVPVVFLENTTVVFPKRQATAGRQLQLDQVLVVVLISTHVVHLCCTTVTAARSFYFSLLMFYHLFSILVGKYQVQFESGA